MVILYRDLLAQLVHNRPTPIFLIYLLGQLVSWTGNRINAIALPLLTIERYGIGLSLGLVAVTRLVPGIILGPSFGYLVDRLPRRATLVVTHLASAGLVALIPFTSELWQLYLLAALVGLAEAPMRTAGFAILPELFPREALYRVNASREVLDALSNLLGPTIAATIITAFGLGWAFWADSGSFLLAALCFLVLRPRPVSAVMQNEGLKDDHSFGTFRVVWRLFRTERDLAGLLAVNLIYTLGIGILLILYAPLAFRLGTDEWGFGAIVTATGAGALLGTAVAPRLGPRLTPRRALVGLGCSGLLLVASGSTLALPPLLILLLLAHIPESLCYLVFATESQRRVPPAFLGRYYGVVMAALAAALPLGNLIGGAIAARFDPRFGLGLVGIGFVAMACFGLLRPNRTAVEETLSQK